MLVGRARLLEKGISIFPNMSYYFVNYQNEWQAATKHVIVDFVYVSLRTSRHVAGSGLAGRAESHPS